MLTCIVHCFKNSIILYRDKASNNSVVLWLCLGTKNTVQGQRLLRRMCLPIVYVIHKIHIHIASKINRSFQWPVFALIMYIQVHRGH